MTEKINKNIKTITDRIVSGYKPEQIILFGSHAWGRPTKDSDVDIFIIKKGRRNFLKDQQKVRKIINGEIAADILIYSPEKVEERLNLGDFFFKNIMAKGVRLYERR